MVELLLISGAMLLALCVPGTLGLFGLGVPLVWALCCSPIISLSLFSIIGEVLYATHITASPVLILGASLVLALLVLICGRKLFHGIRFPKINPAVPLVALVLGLALGYNLFLSRLPHANAIFQAYDLTQHLNLIQAISESGSFTSRGANFYLSATDQAISPFPYGGFYPAAWHCFCALFVDLLHISVPVSINASLFAFTCVVFPLAMSALVSSLFDTDKLSQLCGAVLCMCFVSFPWALLSFGPVYPNVVGFCTVPIALLLFIMILRNGLALNDRIRLGIALIIAMMGLALLHPNTLFTCAVILIPYCLSMAWNAFACGEDGLADTKNRKALAICLGLAIFFAGIWYAAFKLPFLHDTVTHVWPQFSNPFQQIVNALTLSYTYGFWSEIAGQWVLAALVIIGLVKCLHSPSQRWMGFSYLFAVAIGTYSASHTDDLKQILAGFWYTDPMRLAAMCSIAAIPIAATGLAWCIRMCIALARRYNDPRGKHTSRKKIAVVLTCLVLLLTFMPGFNLPGSHHQYTEQESAAQKDLAPKDWAKNFHTTYGDYRTAVNGIYGDVPPLRDAEKSFLDKAKQITGDALVINDPMDGSFLGYGYNGIRMYYRNFVGYGASNETPESRCIRASLSEFSSNDEVRSAVKAIGAKYVVQLSQEGSDCSLINLREDYKPQSFAGISAITEDTPGFTLVLREGDLKLYQIDE